MEKKEKQTKQKPKKFNPADNFKGLPGPGRKLGGTNKITRNLKQLVLDTIERLESEDKSLAVEAANDPKWFYVNFVKPMLPKELDITADLSENLYHVITRKIVDLNDRE